AHFHRFPGSISVSESFTSTTQTAPPKASGPDGKSDGKSDGKGGGLQGVVAAQSEICFIDGNAGRLVYRGYEIADLVEHATFEETAYLLWNGKLPNRAELTELKRQLGASATLPAHVMTILRALPAETQPMDALRAAASALGATDPDLEDNSPEANHRKAVRLP